MYFPSLLKDAINPVKKNNTTKEKSFKEMLKTVLANRKQAFCRSHYLKFCGLKALRDQFLKSF